MAAATEKVTVECCIPTGYRGGRHSLNLQKGDRAVVDADEAQRLQADYPKGFKVLNKGKKPAATK